MCERPSTCRWHASQVVARSTFQSRFLNFHQSSGYGTRSTCRLARSPVAPSRETVLPRNLQVRCARKKAVAIRCTCSLCMALCHALLFACAPFSARNAFTLIFTSSEDPPERFVALVPWLWAETVRTCALPRFDQVFRERGADVQRGSLDVCFVRFDQPAESHLVAYLSFQSSPVGRYALCRSRSLRCSSAGET